MTGSVLADDATAQQGDTAWMMTSTALVLLMSAPQHWRSVHGGLVRSKNMLSVLMQSLCRSR